MGAVRGLRLAQHGLNGASSTIRGAIGCSEQANANLSAIHIVTQICAWQYGIELNPMLLYWLSELVVSNVCVHSMPFVSGPFSDGLVDGKSTSVCSL